MPADIKCLITKGVIIIVVKKPVKNICK